MEIRELKPSEYHKLEGHPFLTESGVPSPHHSRILVAEDGGEIVAFWMLVQVPHLEPIWIDPRYRRSMLAGRLWKAMRRLLDALHIKSAFCCSDRPEIEQYVHRLGFTETKYKIHLYKE